MTIFTVGHSSHPWPTFRSLLEGSGVSAVVDIRSSPYSRFRHFNRENLEARLNEIGIEYLHLGDALGGHPKAGAEDYASMGQARAFKSGIGRVRSLGAKARPALMCSEHDPIVCHRFLLVGRRLAEEGVDLRHILRDGSVEPHVSTEDRLVASSKRGLLELGDRKALLEGAYRRQEARVTGKHRTKLGGNSKS